MPLVRITLNVEAETSARRAVADAVHRALVEDLGVPDQDRFQILESCPNDVIYDRNYLGVARSDRFAVVQIFMALGRTIDQKKELYAAIANRLVESAGFRSEDVFVNLVEVPFENWSFGKGEAQYADKSPAHLAAIPAIGA